MDQIEISPDASDRITLVCVGTNAKSKMSFGTSISRRRFVPPAVAPTRSFLPTVRPYEVPSEENATLPILSFRPSIRRVSWERCKSQTKKVGGFGLAWLP